MKRSGEKRFATAELATAGVLCGLGAVLLVLKPGQVPPLWFDEGWVVSLARNWVELGHYGHLRMGLPVPATILNTGLPAVAPVALSFRLFGMGPWQARLPGLLFTLGALCLLAHRLYNQKVAIGALAAALLLQMCPDLHPALVGRQALGEMPALFFLLAGLVSLSWAEGRPAVFVPLSALLLGLSLRTKPQMLPFIIAALSVPLCRAVLRRRRRTAGLLGTVLCGALVAFFVLAWGEKAFLHSSALTAQSGNEPYAVLFNVDNLRTYVFVLRPSARIAAVLAVILCALPAVAGLAYAGLKYYRKQRQHKSDAFEGACREALWVLATSWLCWYVLFSIGFTRYLLPAVFLGSVHVSLLIVDIAGRFDPLRLIAQAALVIKERRFGLRQVGILFTSVTVLVSLLLTLRMLYNAYSTHPDDSVCEAATFLNTYTDPGAVIETYDSELFFLLERTYHYPPDLVQHQLNRRTFLGERASIDYDPLSADPDYLVVGPMSRFWKLYDPVLEAGAFHLIHEDPRYEVYERVR